MELFHVTHHWYYQDFHKLFFFARTRSQTPLVKVWLSIDYR
jgi:hypothetical protein